MAGPIDKPYVKVPPLPVPPGTLPNPGPASAGFVPMFVEGLEPLGYLVKNEAVKLLEEFAKMALTDNNRLVTRKSIGWPKMVRSISNDEEAELVVFVSTRDIENAFMNLHIYIDVNGKRDEGIPLVLDQNGHGIKLTNPLTKSHMRAIPYKEGDLYCFTVAVNGTKTRLYYTAENTVLQQITTAEGDERLRKLEEANKAKEFEVKTEIGLKMQENHLRVLKENCQVQFSDEPKTDVDKKESLA
jgi:hypothetical protein